MTYFFYLFVSVSLLFFHLSSNNSFWGTNNADAVSVWKLMNGKFDGIVTAEYDYDGEIVQLCLPHTGFSVGYVGVRKKKIDKFFHFLSY
jgi:hypothetical protein